MKKSFVIFTGIAVLAVLAGMILLHPSERSSPAGAGNSGKNPATKTQRVADPQTALAERLKAAREISTNLTNAELKELLAFLAKPLNERTREEDLLAINEVMNQLRSSGMACGEYANALCSLIRDGQTHPVVRDYAIQHAASWMKDAANGNAPAQLTEEDRKHLLDCMVAFLQEPSSLHETGYGTALNVLRTLEENYLQETQDIFTQCAPRICNIANGSEPSPLSNRVSAIQSMPSMPDRPAAQAMVRSMVTDSPIGSPVKLVAIATLGELGDPGDVEILRQIEQSDSRLTYAARSAVMRLQISLNFPSR